MLLDWEIGEMIFKKGLDGRRGGPILHDTRESIKWEMGYLKSEYGFNCCIIYRIFRSLLK